MIVQSKSDSSYLDRIQSKCQMIEQNLKNFKLKSRATYQQLVEQEQTLMAELSASADKFEAWEAEEPTTSKRPPAGRVPAAVARLGMPGGSARI